MKIVLHWILFLGQTLGDAMILSHLVPMLRQFITSGLDGKPSPKIFVFAALGITVIQVCYWLDLHWFATLRLRYIPVLGNVILFLARLNFIFAGATFSAVYLVRFKEVQMSPLEFALLFAVLFSMFCYTLELERLGGAFVKRNEQAAPENNL
ncbi:MAG TPA: hypothetical protein VE860_22945 [Chthoniobacterales bacterium]|jgi:hypothetical protein|nr:hypothetical protein [Chthoniobacterales bacterium]